MVHAESQEWWEVSIYLSSLTSDFETWTNLFSSFTAFGLAVELPVKGSGQAQTGALVGSWGWDLRNFPILNHIRCVSPYLCLCHISSDISKSVLLRLFSIIACFQGNFNPTDILYISFYIWRWSYTEIACSVIPACPKRIPSKSRGSIK